MQRSGATHKDGKRKGEGGVSGPSGQGRGALEGGLLSERALNWLRMHRREKGWGVHQQRKAASTKTSNRREFLLSPTLKALQYSYFLQRWIALY